MDDFDLETALVVVPAVLVGALVAWPVAEFASLVVAWIVFVLSFIAAAAVVGFAIMSGELEPVLVAPAVALVCLGLCIQQLSPVINGETSSSRTYYEAAVWDDTPEAAQRIAEAYLRDSRGYAFSSVQRFDVEAGPGEYVVYVEYRGARIHSGLIREDILDQAFVYVDRKKAAVGTEVWGVRLPAAR